MQFKLSGAQSGLLTLDVPLKLNFTTSARVRGTFTLENLQNALERLRHHHPMLAVRIAPATDHAPACLTTDGVPPIPLRVVERVSAQDWVREVECEIAQPTNYATGPLFRCVWLRGAEVSDLILVCDHIAADGLAGIYALRSLLEMLADPALNPEPLFSPSMAELIPPAILTRINGIISAAADAPPRPYATHHQQADKKPLRVLPFEVDEAQTSALVSRAHAENVTVQAALCTAFALTFAEMHPEEPIRKMESPVNVRQRLLQPVGEVYGNYISLIFFDIDCSSGQEHAWEIARHVKRSLNDATDEQLYTIPLVIMAVTDKPLQGPVVEINYDLSLSNLGRVNIPTHYGKLQLESIYAPTMGPSNPEHRILGVTTFNGRMRCTFTSCDPQAQQIIKRANEILTGMLSNC